jgi:hypothetical protein
MNHARPSNRALKGRMMNKNKTIGRLAWPAVAGILLVFGGSPARAANPQETGTKPAAQNEQKLDDQKKLKEEQMRLQEKLSDVKQLTIRNSGFGSRSTVIIRYRDADKKIVEVIENGKSLPSSEFPRYEPVVQKVLELPEIDRLIPEIDRARRLAESPRVPEERVLEEMMALRDRLERLNSDVARRYREATELQAAASMGRLAEEISASKDLSNEEKIRKLQELIRQAEELHVRGEEKARQTMLTQFAATQAARRLIEELERSKQMTQEEKLKAIQKLLEQTRQMELAGEGEQRRGEVEFRAAEILSRMLREIAERNGLSDLEKEKEMQALIEESQRMHLEHDLMIGVEKFRFDLNRLLEKEGLMPKGPAEFVLKRSSCTIDGKKLPAAVHEKIMQMCQEALGKTFKADTKLVLQLNEKR